MQKKRTSIQIYEAPPGYVWRATNGRQVIEASCLVNLFKDIAEELQYDVQTALKDNRPWENSWSFSIEKSPSPLQVHTIINHKKT